MAQTELERLELEATCAKVARTLQEALKEGGQPLGFCLLMFDFGEKGNFAYAANADRADVVRLLKEAHEKVGAAAQ